jgi:hypothetical protein
MAKKRKSDDQEHLRRVRRICAAMPGMTEKLSHGEPTSFRCKKVFAMFANNHHNDGYIAVWIPAPPGVQAMLIHNSPETYFRPPYVGMRGWVGIELDAIGDVELASHIRGSLGAGGAENIEGDRISVPGRTGRETHRPRTISSSRFPSEDSPGRARAAVIVVDASAILGGVGACAGAPGAYRGGIALFLAVTK